MNQGDKPDLLIFHGPSCLDGFACVWAVHMKWPDVPIFEGIYGQAPPDVTGLRVLIADFSYPEDVTREMAAAAVSITVLDHHESSRLTFNRLFENGVIRGEHDLTRSGAHLTWEYVWGNRHAPKLIEHVQDRDLWKFEIEGTPEVTATLASFGQDEAIWTGIGKALEGGRRMEVINDGAAILRQRDIDIVSCIRAGRREMIIGGHRVQVCNAPYFWASDIGHALAVGSDAGFAATYTDLPHGRQFSLRGTTTEVHKIAEEYGGGGHPGAAGFTAPVGWEGDVDQEAPVETIRLNTGGQVKVDG